MSTFAAGLAVVALLCAGSGIVECVFRSPSQNRAERGLRLLVAVAVGLGLWSSSYVMVLFSFGASPSRLLRKDAVLALGGSLVLLWARRSRLPAIAWPSAHPGPRWMRRIVVTLFALAIAIAPVVFVIRVKRTPDGFWDAWAIWNLRARFLVRSHEEIALTFSPELGWSTHPDYPLLLPGLIAQWWTIAMHESAAVPPIIAGVFAMLVTGTLTVAVTLLRGLVSGLTAGLVLLGSSVFLRVATHQVADVPLAAYALLASVVVAVAIERPSDQMGRLFALAGLVTSLGAWTKNDGILHTAALVAAVLLFQPRATPWRTRGRQLGRFALGASPLVALLLHFKLRYAPPNDLLTGLSLSEVVHRVIVPERYGIVFNAMWQRVGRVSDWNGFLVALPLLPLGFARQRPARSASPVMLAASLFVVVEIAVVYVLTPHDIEWHIATSMDRLLVQWWPSFVFAVFLTLPPVTGEGPPLARDHPSH